MDFYPYKIIHNCTVKIQAIRESIKIIPKNHPILPAPEWYSLLMLVSVDQIASIKECFH